MLRTEQHFPCSADIVQSLFFDERFIHSKMDSMGVGNLEIREFGKSLGQRQVFRFVSKASMGEKLLDQVSLPEKLKKFLNAKSVVMQETEWDLETDDIKCGRFRGQLEGMPIEFQGDITIRPHGRGCIMEISCQPNARIPIIGGAMNKLIEHVIDRNLEEDYEFNQNYIQHHMLH